jgi:tRNA threonylcarbamoyladenosine biosynthesis protein TsaE
MIIEVKSTEAMMALGKRLGEMLRGGEVIELVGDVGAGKTTFVKGVALGMGIDEDVQSPSFTINRMYTGKDNLELAHYDFYRLETAGIMADEINETIHDPRTVTIVEWAGAVAGVLPDDRLTIGITATAEDMRNLVISAGGRKSREFMEKAK